MILNRKLKNKLKAAARFALDPEIHRQLGDIYSKLNKWYPAIAEYRTSITLGKIEPELWLSLAGAYLAVGQVEYANSICEKILTQGVGEVEEKAKKILVTAAKSSIRPLESISPNRYQRLRRIADYINDLYDKSNFSVLDVGGGDGMLCLFLPGAKYVLAEPRINGISGTELTFKKKSFDVVVACHVLEHIKESERSEFLSQLCDKAKRHVLLLNPFFDPKGQEGLALIAELTGVEWAKEHIACKMPQLEEVKQFIEENNYSARIYANGSKTSSIAYVFLEYYAGMAKREKDLERINTLFNTSFYENMTNTTNPNDFLIEIKILP